MKYLINIFTFLILIIPSVQGQDIIGGEINIRFDTANYPLHTIIAKVYTDESMNIYRQSIELNSSAVTSTLYKHSDTLITPNIRLSYFEGLKYLIPGADYSFYIQDDVETSKYINVDNGQPSFPLVIYSSFQTFPVLGNETPYCYDHHQDWINDNGILKYQVNCVDYENDSIAYFMRNTMRALDSSSYQLPSNISITPNGLIEWHPPIDTGNYLFIVRLFTYDLSRIERVITVPVTSQLLSSNKEIPLKKNSLHVFPNPITDLLTIKFDYYMPDRSEIQIFDIIGQLVHQEQMTHQSHQIQLGHLENGVYIVRVQAGDKVFTQRIIKQ